MQRTISVCGPLSKSVPLDVTLDELAIASFFPADDATSNYLRSRFG